MRASPRKPSHAYPQKTASQSKSTEANHAFKSQTKAERAVEIKSGHIDSATLGDMKVRVFGETAVVTGTDDEITTTDGKKSRNHCVSTDFFVERNGKWLAVASQAAQIK